MSKWDGSVAAHYSTSDDRIEVRFGETSIDVTLDEATALRAALDQAPLTSALPKCPECNGRKMLRVDGKYRMCGTCEYTGLAPVTDGGAA
ncbi:hypothetical protein ATK86_5292 [Nocardia fluminea]|uniref:Uncharacterized protein n=2 Tax=Nocardia fluminea TaxID=134984 RepID=A0A2N3VGY9_9NOCA|nr:hypothetical protein ATK86_5292 [Nocardia fluminea]